MTAGDFGAALAVFLLVFLATLPVALPFAFIHDAHRALRISNGIALVMLFLGGYYLGEHGWRHAWLSGLVTLALGVVLVWATIALWGDDGRTGSFTPAPRQQGDVPPSGTCPLFERRRPRARMDHMEASTAIGEARIRSLPGPWSP